MGLYGLGPVGSARLLADIGDIARFPTRARFASWNGTAPIDASSGQQVRHRLSRAGNRRINRVLHIMAIVQIRHDTEGRAYYRRKLAAGKTPMEALRCLKRRLSDVVYRQLAADMLQAGHPFPDSQHEADPGGHVGAALQSSAAGLNPIAGTSDQSLSRTRHQPRYADPAAPENSLLDIEGSHVSAFRPAPCDDPGRATTDEIGAVVRSNRATTDLDPPLGTPCPRKRARSDPNPNQKEPRS
jgi:Transposase IS116/IS110/IS902 family